MPASQAAFEALAVRLRFASDPGSVDMLLDTWLDYRDRATEWDAKRWGFEDPDRWCERERAELNRRARLYVGPPPMDHEGERL
ncbi:hypothetical protein [Streptomyces sp. NBC_00038]|uniref:hypothetical protein n=1 Tax=Streptomyces sp. NBC_00038 TaxID=2903615 RepID=UPI0022527AEC|nr:hypothetical protein [Streptomyces sp. NBC_00038]MCX5562746.1 hypothetical protein [Streptomyces sp. NBC_00038]MCX5563604.1 hypothetical protein [Streptomyces sp. NBC_00038]